MQPQNYEGTTIMFCDTCWGHWLSHKSLAKILSTQNYGFSRDERETVFATWIDDAPDTRHGLSCPECKSEMSESAFDDDCPVLVDRCAEHGTWLDAGEIKKLQVFVENR
jgi:Zn-finger nucleic acid-binding protein